MEVPKPFFGRLLSWEGVCALPRFVGVWTVFAGRLKGLFRGRHAGPQHLRSAGLGRVAGELGLGESVRLDGK